MTPLQTAFVAANRFGLGARPGDLPRIAADPSGWLLGQLVPQGLPHALRDLPSSESLVAEFQQARKAGRDALKALRPRWRKGYLAEAGQRSLAGVRSDAPFHERLVAFWSNHFTVSVRKAGLFALAGAFEREAIRPNLTGRFAGLISAAVKHPAMLVYLDNAQSIGPNSPVGRRRNRGLNENLAREVLELHSLGVEGGYDQGDVLALAKILTGWSIARRGAGINGFKFRARAHEPGDKMLLGRRYREDGLAEGEAALAALARHPSTARHIARKLARHFVADQPPETAVERLARVFQDTDGDLTALAEALIRLPEAWQEPLAKVKTPQDLVVSTLRATGFEGAAKQVVLALRLLGQAPWAAPSPAGWPDLAADWIGPDAVLKRIELASAVADRAGDRIDPRVLSEASIAPVAEAATLRAIARAPSRQAGLTLLLASAEFQRR